MDTFKEKSVNFAYLTVLILKVKTVLLRERGNIFRDYNLHIVKRIDNNFINIIYLRRRGTIIHILLILDSSQWTSICVTVYNPKNNFISGVQSKLAEVTVTKKTGFFYSILKFFEETFSPQHYIHTHFLC